MFAKKTPDKIRIETKLPKTEHCAMALGLDMKTRKEHIIIGEMDDIWWYLAGSNPAEERLLLNVKRPFGTLIEELFDSCSTDARDAATGFWPDTIRNRPDLSYKAAEVVERMYASENLVWRFTALRLWQEYCHIWDQPPTRAITDTLDDIIRPVCTSRRSQIETWQNIHTYANLYSYLDLDELKYPARIMYGEGTRMTAYVVSDFNVYPLFIHYLHTVYTRNEFFQYCKRCGKMYPAHTANIKGFCSEECRKAQQKENRQRYDEKVEDDAAERAYRNCYMYWYNRLKKIRNKMIVPGERLEFLNAEFEKFREQAKPMKRDVQSGKKPDGEFTAWLFSQQNYFDTLIEDIEL